MEEQDELRAILAAKKRPSLKQLVEEHGLICGADGDIYFGEEASEKVRESFERDKKKDVV